jgi:hypothetical protein
MDSSPLFWHIWLRIEIAKEIPDHRLTGRPNPGRSGSIPDAGPAVSRGLDPSTVDADRDDPTIRKFVSFARKEGYGGITVVNLDAYRVTVPGDLRKQSDPYHVCG